GREYRDAGTASKTRTATKDDPSVNGRVAAEAGRTACRDRTAVASCTTAPARAGSPGDTAAEARRSGNTTLPGSKHRRGGSLRRQHRFGENAGRRQGSCSFEVLGHQP